MKKYMIILLICSVISCLLLTACEYVRDKGDEWQENYDLTFPELDEAGSSEETANSYGWYCTLYDDFSESSFSDVWTTSPHGLRETEYWCDDMVSISNGNAVVTATYLDSCDCDICAESGFFTSGIETRSTEDSEGFYQAFGYFEARIKVPESGGMWSAFWLQTESISSVGNDGEDGSEIDIYESSFYNTDRTSVGHAVHYDGYGSSHKCMDRISETDTDLYEGYHTYALKWTPTEYVFYVDGEVTWATDFGGVCKVPAYLRFTNEIREGKVGPYGQKLGDFDGGELLIDYVVVYQNTAYLSSIMSVSDFN